MNLVAAMVVGILAGAGAHLMTRRDLVRLCVGSLLLSNAAVLLLLAPSLRATGHAVAPITGLWRMADPIAQALALTTVVITFGTTTLLLRVLLALERSHGTLDAKKLGDLEDAESEQSRQGGLR